MAVILKVKVPGVSGVPVIAPVDEFKDRPEGREYPEVTEYVIETGPEATETPSEYASPSVTVVVDKVWSDQEG